MPFARPMSNLNNGDDDDFDDMDLGDFDEIGISKADLDDGKFKLDPNNPPKLDFEHYTKLKAINFSDRDEIRDKEALEAEESWQDKLDELRTATETRGAKYSSQEMQRILDHKMTEPEEEGLGEQQAQAPMPGDAGYDSLAAAAGLPPLPKDDIYEYARVSPEEVYDPGAFPVAMETDLDMPKKVKGICIFCLPDPSKLGVKAIKYTNVQLLHKFINERGMITSRKFNYNCAKHQRKLAKAIKQARYIGLLSYTDNFVAPESFAIDDWGREPESLDAQAQEAVGR